MNATGTIDGIEVVVRLLRDEIPVPAVHRGWSLMDLSHDWTDTGHGVEETWAVSLYGPISIYTDWQQMVGRPRLSYVMIQSGKLGAIEASSVEELVAQVSRIVETLGLRDLT